MAFCSNCGKELAAGAKFCFECGTPVEKTDETVRRTVYSGEIHKCPACGEALQSMTAICPACGHEINSAKLASALKEFIDEIRVRNGNLTVNLGRISTENELQVTKLKNLWKILEKIKCTAL